MNRSTDKPAKGTQPITLMADHTRFRTPDNPLTPQDQPQPTDKAHTEAAHHGSCRHCATKTISYRLRTRTHDRSAESSADGTMELSLTDGRKPKGFRTCRFPAHLRRTSTRPGAPLPSPLQGSTSRPASDAGSSSGYAACAGLHLTRPRCSRYPSPHKWAVGTTFEWEFELPITTNPGYGHKSASKRKTRKSSKPKAAPAHARKTSKPATLQTVKPKASEKPKRVRLTPEERQERARARAAEKRSKLKEQGLCKDCQQPAILVQTRCTSCADKHRKTRRPRQSTGNH